MTYYLGSVLNSAGITAMQTQLGINIGMSVFNLVCAAVGTFLAERIGRRNGFCKYNTYFLIHAMFGGLILDTVYSTGTMAILLIIVATLTKAFSSAPTVASSAAQVAMIFLFYGSYSFVWTPLATLYPVEVLSYSMRGNGLGFYNGAVYGTAFINTFAIPYAMEWSAFGFYLITAFWNLLCEVTIVFFYFPETKGKTLEEIDVIFEGVSHANLDITIGEVLKGVDVERVEKVTAAN